MECKWQSKFTYFVTSLSINLCTKFVLWLGHKVTCCYITSLTVTCCYIFSSTITCCYIISLTVTCCYIISLTVTCNVNTLYRSDICETDTNTMEGKMYLFLILQLISNFKILSIKEFKNQLEIIVVKGIIKICTFKQVEKS